MTTPTQRNDDTLAFEDRLHQIRELQAERRTRHQLLRSGATRARSQQIMSALDAVGRIETVLAGLTQDLGTELGRHVELTHRLFDGRYQLGLRFGESVRDGEGRCQDYFSRVQLLIEPNAETGRLALECRSTVRNRDLDSASLEDDVSVSATGRIQAFLEEQLLAFAQAWCACDELTHTEDLLDLRWAEAALAA